MKKWLICFLLGVASLLTVGACTAATSENVAAIGKYYSENVNIVSPELSVNEVNCIHEIGYVTHRANQIIYSSDYSLNKDVPEVQMSLIAKRDYRERLCNSSGDIRFSYRKYNNSPHSIVKDSSLLKQTYLIRRC